MHIDQLLLQIAAVLLVGRLLARVVRWMGQPVVIAEIIAGIALGPSLLGLLAPGLMTSLFPQSSMNVLGTVAQLGLVFFMFLVGLEFDPRQLEGRMRAAVAISGAGIVVPLTAGIAVAMVLPASLTLPGVPLHSFALFVGVAMSVTAFPVLARILTERHLVKTPVGAMALAAAAVDDVAAWSLLALVAGIASASGMGGAVVTVGWTLVYAAVVWFLVRPLLHRLGPRQGNEVSVELMTVAVLLVVVSAYITEKIGIHALFGGFLMGAAMPRRGGLSSALAEKMEDFVTIVLLPLFFAYSGLRTQMGLLHNLEDIGLTLLLLAVAIVGKFGGSALAARLTGLGVRESAAIGILMNTRGLMEIVVLNVGLDLGVISERMFAMMVVVAVVTTWITTPLLRRVYSVEHIQPQAEKAPPAPAPAPVGGLLVCVADPQIAGPLARLAAALVRGRPGPVWVVHLRDIDRPRDYLRDATAPSEPLAEFERAAAPCGLSFEPIAFSSSRPGEDIVRIAALKSVQTVLLGTHRSTFGLESLRGVTGEVLDGTQAEVGILLDRGLEAVGRLALSGPPSSPLNALSARLEAGGAQRVGADEPVDLRLIAFHPMMRGPMGGELPEDGGASTLILRSAQVEPSSAG